MNKFLATVLTIVGLTLAGIQPVLGQAYHGAGVEFGTGSSLQWEGGSVLCTESAGVLTCSAGDIVLDNELRVNVQIGVGVAPAVDLHISSTTPQFRLEDEDATGYAQISSNDASSLVITIDPTNVDASSLLQVLIDGGEKFRLDESARISNDGAAPSYAIDWVSPSADLYALRFDQDKAAGTVLGALRNTGAFGTSNFVGFDFTLNSSTAARVANRVLSRFYDTTDATRSSEMTWQTSVSGTLATRMTLRGGLQLGSPTGGDPGTGSINLAGGLGINTVPAAGVDVHVSDAAAEVRIEDTDASGYYTFTSNNSGFFILNVDPTNVDANSSAIINIDGGEIARFRASGLFINDTANANQTWGITVNSGAAPAGLNILTFKGTDIATGMTTVNLGEDVETDDWYNAARIGGTAGGLYETMIGETSLATGWSAEVWQGAPATGNTSASAGAIMIYVGQHDGANAAVDMAADSNCLAVGEIDSGGSRLTRMILKCDDGELHLGNTTLQALDSHNDAQLARSMQWTTTGGAGLKQYPFDGIGRGPTYSHVDLMKAGLVGPKDKDGQFMIKVQPYLAMHDGAIWQNYNRAATAQAQVAALAEVLAQIAPEAVALASARLQAAGLPGLSVPPVPTAKPASATVQ